MVSPNIYPIYELLESVKEPVLQIQSCRISTAQGSNVIYPTGVPVRVDRVAETTGLQPDQQLTAIKHL